MSIIYKFKITSSASNYADMLLSLSLSLSLSLVQYYYNRSFSVPFSE